MRFDNIRKEIAENPESKTGGLTLLSKIEKVTPNKRVREIRLELLMRYGALGTKWKANINAKIQNTSTGKESEEAKETEWFLGNYENIDKEAFVLSSALNRISPLVYELCALEEVGLDSDDYDRSEKLGVGVSEFGVPLFTGEHGVGSIFISTALLGFETDGIKPKRLGVSFGDIFSGRCKFSDKDDSVGTTFSFEVKFVRKVEAFVADKPQEKSETESVVSTVEEPPDTEDVKPKKRGRPKKVLVEAIEDKAVENEESVYAIKKKTTKKSTTKKVKEKVVVEKDTPKKRTTKKTVVDVDEDNVSAKPTKNKKEKKVSIFSTGIEDPEAMIQEFLEDAR